MFSRKLVSLPLLFVCLAGAALAQTGEPPTVRLVVDKGYPLQVLLTGKLRFKENEPVHAIVTEPVYAFDREVIPSGTQLEGKITKLQTPGKWKRISTLLGGNFTPLHDPQITFDTMILANGRRIPIETGLMSAPEKVVEFGKKSDGGLQNALAARKPGKDIFKNMLWGLSPYHPQSAPVGTRLSVVLERPVDFGEAIVEQEALARIGLELSSDSIISVRLLTPLNSRTARVGASVDAVTTRPLFSADQHLVFPAGTPLHGSVTEVRAASKFHHNGELAFSFATIGGTQPIAGSLLSIEVNHEMKDLRIKENNATAIVESKKRFISPAWSFFKAGRAFGSTSRSLDDAILGAYRNKFLKQFAGAGSESGFGLSGSIAGSMVPPVGIGLGLFSAGRSAYSNFIGRGRDINLPANTGMQIRINGSSGGSALRYFENQNRKLRTHE